MSAAGHACATRRRGSVAVAAVIVLTGCGGPRVAAPAGDPVLSGHLADGASAHARRDLARAEDAYRQALRRAEQSDNPDGIRAAARNLAVLAMESGDWADAGGLLDEAAAHAPDPADAAEIEVLRARVDAGQGATGPARERLAALPADLPEGLRESAQLLLAELSLIDNRPEEARALAAALADRPGPLAGRRRRLLAVLAEGDAAWGRAAAARAAEAAAWRDASDWRAMALALERAGDDLLRHGQPVEAVRTWLRAARSLAAQGDPSRARRILDRCRQAGPVDSALDRRVQRLEAEVAAEAPPAGNGQIP